MSLGGPAGAGNVMRGTGGLGGGFGGMPGPPMAMAAESASVVAMDAGMDKMAKSEGETPTAVSVATGIDLGAVTARKNLAETAFFIPFVKQSPDGSFEIEFSVPEALTTWRVMAFAHDTELKSGYLDAKLTTSKDLMVQPNPPRFLREGDTLDFSVKVTNSSKESQNGKVALQLLDAISERSVDKEFGNTTTERTFQLEAGESKAFSWRLNVPDGAYPIIYKAIGGTTRSSDGEEGMLPILSKRVLVTESLPLPIRGNTTKDFEFRKLLESANSDSLKHQSLTVQMVSQPSWYAVLALPYLMEYPYPCSEQIFNRLYANSLARHIATSDPKIRKVFDVWRNFQPDALTSPLQKNEDLKTVLIEETPWLRDAQQETEARRNVGLLFEENRLSGEVSRAIQQLTEMQLENGMWPWFPGGRDNEYLSLYIVTGFGRLKHLGVEIDRSLALKALTRLDAWVHEMYDTIVRESNPEKNHLSSVMALYLYGRSFYLDDVPIAENHQVAIDFWKRQARQYWLSQPRQCQAQIALGLHRMKDERTPDAIVKSLLEYATSNEEMGMFWNDGGQAWWWYHAPIETQAMMIEVFDEVAQNQRVVEDCKVWLLKQKQTQNWKTTKSTADAVYALLLRGANMLASDALVEVQLAGKRLEPAKVEAGTGFYEQKFLRTEVNPEFGKIRLTKTDPGVSWGSIHWQYLEDVAKITPHDGTPLKLEKQIFRKEFTKAGPELQAINGPLQVGDELVCRIVLRTDRDMEYVHLKDHRGSGTEPVNVISSYRFQDGLGYYESTRDTASHFFIDYLPKGTYVFEYSVRIQHAGKYPTGLANIECMYAPEFNSHSGSILLDVMPR
ncbi:MAG: alpha-2-macroglobulin family protein [Planctomycetes bacterium]|nr:alpha-2-macroglobulin family protein [Planctomycetota bacterium]